MVLSPYRKINSKLIINLKVLKLKSFRKNIGANLCDLQLNKDILDWTKQKKSADDKKNLTHWSPTKLILCIKNSILKMKWQATD